MWLNDVNLIKNINSKNLIDYCIDFSNAFNFEIIPLEDYLKIIENPNNDFFPIINNINRYFLKGDVQFFINFFYHLNDLKNIDFLLFNENNLSFTDLLFNIDSKNYYLSLFSLDTEDLLIKDENYLLFLFLFFIPKKQNILINIQKNYPLICCNKISLNNFNMLLYLTKHFNVNLYNEYIKDYNFNLILLEDFFQYRENLIELNDFNDCFKHLPINKLYILFQNKCSLYEFLTFRKQKFYYTYKIIESFIPYLQKFFEMKSIDESIPDKQYIKSKIIKI